MVTAPANELDAATPLTAVKLGTFGVSLASSAVQL
jgi:hypothetical protein